LTETLAAHPHSDRLAEKRMEASIANGAKRVVIVGAGFGGLNCAKVLGGRPGLDVLVIDRRNHHLFQPLLYQVAMAGLSPADIAVPIRSVLSKHKNIQVLEALAERVDLDHCRVHTNRGTFTYDYLILACGSKHTYFGHVAWEEHAPGLKTLEQATEIRRRVLTAFERAEAEDDPETRRAWLTFVVVGGGPTGVELSGALGELSRSTLKRDFRRIDPQLTRVVLIEAGPRILPSFDAALSATATRDLERLGVQVWTNTAVTEVDEEGVDASGNRLQTKTVLWAAGVQAASLGASLNMPLDRQGRVVVSPELCIPGHSNVFVVGDQAHTVGPDAQPLPGVATVALQQGRYVGSAIVGDLRKKARKPFFYADKGQMATIGRSRAVLQTGRLRLAGPLAWMAWLLVHIYYLSGFKNRALVLIQWAYSYFTFARGARLIVNKRWQFYEAVTDDRPTTLGSGQSATGDAPRPPV